MSDRHIVQLDVVLLCTLLQQLRNTLRHLLSLRQQLLSIVLSHHSLHDLVTERRKHTVTEIRTHFAMNLGKVVEIRMGQHSKRNPHSLQILCTCLCGNLTRRCANVVNVGILQITHFPGNHLDKWNFEMCSLVYSFGQDSTETIEDHSAFTSID